MRPHGVLAGLLHTPLASPRPAIQPTALLSNAAVFKCCTGDIVGIQQISYLIKLVNTTLVAFHSICYFRPHLGARSALGSFDRLFPNNLHIKFLVIFLVSQFFTNVLPIQTVKK
jgi:hypothetical protein